MAGDCEGTVIEGVRSGGRAHWASWVPPRMRVWPMDRYSDKDEFRMATRSPLTPPFRVQFEVGAVPTQSP